MSVVAELPEEVLERLSTHARGRLTVGDDVGAVTVDVPVAPLHKQVFLLLTRGGAAEQRLLETTRATFFAEDKAAEWSVRATGRAVLGRPITAESRRPELMHWLPDGVASGGLVAVRFHPETVEYHHGRGTARTRAAGPVPGGARPSGVSRWVTLATDGVVLWFLAMAALDWLGLLFLVDEPEKRRMLLLVLMVIAGSALLGGLTLVDQAARYTRWREGLETDERARLMLGGWEAPKRVRDVGAGMMLFGGVLTVLIGGGAGWQVAVCTVLASAVPLVGAFHLARHAMRRRDAAREIG